MCASKILLTSLSPFQAGDGTLSHVKEEWKKERVIDTVVLVLCVINCKFMLMPNEEEVEEGEDEIEDDSTQVCSYVDAKLYFEGI